MAKLARKGASFQKKLVSGKFSPTRRLSKSVLGQDVTDKLHPQEKFVQDQYEKNFDDIHPLGTQTIQADDMRIAAEQALQAEKNKKPIPVADEEGLARARRRGAQQRRSRGRASTILGLDSETLG